MVLPRQTFPRRLRGGPSLSTNGLDVGVVGGKYSHPSPLKRRRSPVSLSRHGAPSRVLSLRKGRLAAALLCLSALIVSVALFHITATVVGRLKGGGGEGRTTAERWANKSADKGGGLPSSSSSSAREGRSSSSAARTEDGAGGGGDGGDDGQINGAPSPQRAPPASPGESGLPDGGGEGGGSAQTAKADKDPGRGRNGIGIPGKERRVGNHPRFRARANAGNDEGGGGGRSPPREGEVRQRDEGGGEGEGEGAAPLNGRTRRSGGVVGNRDQAKAQTAGGGSSSRGGMPRSPPAPGVGNDDDGVEVSDTIPSALPDGPDAPAVVVVAPAVIDPPPDPVWWMGDDPDEDVYDRTYRRRREDGDPSSYDAAAAAEAKATNLTGLTFLRTVPESMRDHFSTVCHRYRFNHSSMPRTSVIVTTMNERPGLLSITVHSILARTPPELLEEIIVVDDNGIDPEFRGDVDDDGEFAALEALGPLVKVLHNPVQIGCANSRLAGAEIARGEVLMFVDSHVEMLHSTWLQHLLVPIAENPRTMAVQTIEVISDKPGMNFTYSQGGGSTLQYGVVDKSFFFGYQYRRFTDEEGGSEEPNRREPYETPFAPGSLFAMRADEFSRLGGYDRGNAIWGAENTELCLKTWMCGGRVVMVPCSRVGHVYRVQSATEGRFRWPPKIDPKLLHRLGADKPGRWIHSRGIADNITRVVTRNNMRVMAVWVGDHPAKRSYYKTIFGSEVPPPEWRQFEDELSGDEFSLQQAEVRDRNKCRDFDWFDRHVLMRFIGKHHPWHESNPQPINCGGHTARLCGACPHGNGPDWCHGDCFWCSNPPGAGAGACMPLDDEKSCPGRIENAAPKRKNIPKGLELRGRGGGELRGGHGGKAVPSPPEQQDGKGGERQGVHKVKAIPPPPAWQDDGGGERLGGHEMKAIPPPPAQLDGTQDRQSGSDAGKLNATSVKAKGLTLSVVLPCGFEHDFFARTALSVFESTPPDVLKEIIIVDDASDPPLQPLFEEKLPLGMAAAVRDKVRFVRHETASGLIGAKQTGAEAATGDVLVFFDCHVKPDKNYWRPFVEQIGSNYKRVVVPTITSLNVDTWEEFGRPASNDKGGMSKCYLTFDAEFKWTTDETPHVPIMSGGLLAISRRWYFEIGGYDRNMRGWGGENLDQSLRIWRCGGEIVTAPDSYVAHMWRTDNPKTRAKYTLNGADSILNRARAVKAHAGPWFANKTLSFPAFERWRGDGGSSLDASSITDGMGDLDCKPFEWYLNRFGYIYHDAGVLPAKVFQLRAVLNGTSLGKGVEHGMCLQLEGHKSWNNAASPEDRTELSPCLSIPNSEITGGTQWWHKSNRLGDGTCCSSLRVWNTDQCLNKGGMSTSVCSLEPDNEVYLSKRGYLHVGERCMSVNANSMDLHVTDCKGATTWQKRGAFAPIEFDLLSDNMKNLWKGRSPMIPSMNISVVAP